jgi:hypothetical protein
LARFRGIRAEETVDCRFVDFFRRERRHRSVRNTMAIPSKDSTCRSLQLYTRMYREVGSGKIFLIHRNSLEFLRRLP